MPPLDAKAARADGYGGRIAPASRKTDPELATRVYLRTLTPEARRAYQRVKDAPGAGDVSVSLPNGAEVTAPAGGCMAEGRRAVFGSVRRFLEHFYLPQEVRKYTSRALEETPIRDSLSRYEGCMDELGYDAETPQSAFEVAVERFGHRRIGSEPSKAEQKMAVADARCQTDSKFFELLDERILHHAAGWLRANEIELVRTAAIQRDALLRARRILGPR